VPTKRLTDQFVERVKPPAHGRVDYFDASFPALSLRVSEHGGKSWCLFYRINGRQRRYTLGRHPAIKPARARSLATEALNQVRTGLDPAAIKQARRDTPLPEADSFEVLVRDYLERQLSKNTSSGTYKEAKRLLGKDVLPKWRRRLASNIARADAVDLIDKIAERTPVHANRVHARLHALFNWAVEKGRLGASPMVGLKPPTKEQSRDRWLNEQEIIWFWSACERLGYPFGRLFQMLLLSAQRRDEVGLMEWTEIDLGKRIWTVPGEKAKSARVHDVPLSDLAIEVLQSCPRLGRHVFVGRGGVAATGFSYAKKALDAAMLEVSGGVEIPPFILHDLRRSAASHMAKLNVPPHVVDRILDHTAGTIRGVAAIYNRFEYFPERQAALAAWGKRIGGLVSSSPDNVVALVKAAS
jgi:integrase